MGTDAVGLRREMTDIKTLLASSLDPLRSQADAHRIELRVEALGDVPLIDVDRDKLAWAVVTLAGNAMRYVARGGASQL